MAYTYTFQLAQRARVKLQREASRHDHNLRLLVGHANLLDSLMISLVEAGREQENWFNETVRGNMAQEAEDDEDDEEEHESVHMVENTDRRWQSEAEGRVMMTQYDDDLSSDESDSDSDCSDDDMEDIHYSSMPALTRKPSYKSLPSSYFGTTTIGVTEVEEYDDDFPSDEDEDGDEDGMYPLQRTASHGSPPMLVADLSDDEDEPTPPSPPIVSLPFTSTSKLQSSPPPFSEGERYMATDYLSAASTLISTY